MTGPAPDRTRSTTPPTSDLHPAEPRAPRPAPTTAAPIADTPWRRPSARMLLVHPLRELRSWIGALVPVLVVGASAQRLSWWMVAVVVVPMAFGVLRWFLTTYRVAGDRLELRSGLLSRRVVTAHLDRVRTVDVTASPLHRVLGLATVRIGTGASSPFVLDGLSRAHAEALRTSLLHRGAVDAPAETPDTPVPRPDDETLLAAFSPGWLRFAPFTLTGLVAVAAVFGAAMQLLDQIGWERVEGAAESAAGASERLVALGWSTLALLGAVVVLVALTVLSITMYTLAYWGYRLVRHPGGTVHLTRGLLTTQSTTIEARRIRGAVLEEPALLRIPRGARARVLTTGLAAESESAGSDLLVPPAPRDVAAAVVDDLAGVPGAACAPLRPHGPAAARRRWTRALVPAAALAVVLGVVAWAYELPDALVAAPALLLPAAALVAHGRVRALGHTVTQGRLVARSGVFPRRREVLDLSNTIGWSFASTPFQRRTGLVTCAALTAAGSGSVAVLDVDRATATALAHAADPDLLAPFLARTDR